MAHVDFFDEIVSRVEAGESIGLNFQKATRDHALQVCPCRPRRKRTRKKKTVVVIFVRWQPSSAARVAAVSARPWTLKVSARSEPKKTDK